MKYIDLGKSFNHFKKQIIMEQETKSFPEIYDEVYNIGVEKCINYCRSQVALYRTINENGNEWRAIDAIVKTLEYFKKPFRKNVNDDIVDIL